MPSHLVMGPFSISAGFTKTSEESFELKEELETTAQLSWQAVLPTLVHPNGICILSKPCLTQLIACFYNLTLRPKTAVLAQLSPALQGAGL